MSKERELLKLCAEAFALHNKCPNLTGDINELLAQPEQEQEPVAWMWEEEGDEGCVETAIDINKPRVNMYRENIRPLYTAPPKREPLSDEEIDKGYQESDGNYYDLAFRDGVRFAEQQHGITGGGE